MKRPRERAEIRTDLFRAVAVNFDILGLFQCQDLLALMSFFPFCLLALSGYINHCWEPSQYQVDNRKGSPEGKSGERHVEYYW